MPQEVWKVFFLHSSWSLPSGLLIGVVNHEQLSVTITAVVKQEISLKRRLKAIPDVNARLSEISNAELLAEQFDQFNNRETCFSRKQFQVLGLFVNENDVFSEMEEQRSTFRKDGLFLVMQKTRSVQPECVVWELKQSTWSTVSNLMLIALDSSVEYHTKILHSTEAPMTLRCSQNGKVVDYAIDSLRDWNAMKRGCDLKPVGKNQFFQDFHNSVLMFLLFKVIFWPLKMSALLLRMVCSSKAFQSRIVDAVVSWPATGCQLKEKYKQLQELVVLNQSKSNSNREVNLLLMLVFDFFLGVVFILLLHQNDFANILSTAFMNFANTTAVSLERLLRWLMGAPAGLKLNRELASFLGHFFLYHIYLWVGYLSTIGPFLAVTIRFASLFGCLGLSVVIALASDVLSILTFHIYCFYVYAARIYCLQVHGLMAFWRLFRGKKWNVLRQRVDSSAFHVDQLFLGTLLFTILLFLLPTTALFYAVFTLLRLAVLIPQSVVAKIILFMNRTPLFSLLLWTVRAGSLVDGIYFQPLPTQTHQLHSWLLLKMKPMSLMKVMAVESLTDVYTEKSSWSSLGRDLLCGYLVYPWGGKRDDQA